jgi:hypothetical protein
MNQKGTQQPPKKRGAHRQKGEDTKNNLKTHTPRLNLDKTLAYRVI